MAKHKEKELWSARERLAFVERNLWWHGTVFRGDLQRVFGISPAQASVDLKLYFAQNPKAANYSLSTKRYEAVPDMKCVVITPRIDEILGLRGPGVPPWTGHAAVEILQVPSNEASAQVQRRVHIATSRGLKIRVRFSPGADEAVQTMQIAPHAFAWDGVRWLVRAWCIEAAEFRTIGLDRIERADWPEEVYTPDDADLEWNAFEEIEFGPHSGLDENQRAIIERDYAMTRGSVKMKVRNALAGSLRQLLGLGGGDPPANRIEEVAGGKAADPKAKAARRCKGD